MRLQDLSLAIGSQFQITIIGQDYKRHDCQAQLLGYHPAGRRLFVALINKSPQILLHAGLEVEGRLQTVLGCGSFKSELDVYHDLGSQPYLELDFPAGIQFQSLRASARIPVDSPVSLQAHTSLGITAQTIHGNMLDLSEHGARVVLEKELTNMVTKVELGVYIEGGGMKRDMTLFAQLKNTAPISDDYPDCGYGYGLKFIERRAADAYFIKAYCQQLQLQGRGISCSE